MNLKSAKRKKKDEDKRAQTHPNIPESISLLQTQIRVPRTAIPLNLTRPVAPADWLQFVRTKHQSDRDDDDGDEGFDDDIVRQGEAGIVEEDGVFVGRVASAEFVSGLVIEYRWIFP